MGNRAVPEDIRGVAAGPGPRPRVLARRLGGRMEVYLIGVLVVVCAVLTVVNPRFLTVRNLFDLVTNYAFLGILALGELVVLISGGIDVSFTAIATVGQYVMGLILRSHPTASVLVAFLIPLPIGVALGAINAVLIYVTRVHPVIITIATLNIFYGLLIFLTGGQWIYNLPVSFQAFAQLKIFQISSRMAGRYGVSVLTVFWALAIVLTWVILTYLPVGRKVYALGGNPEAARRAGFNIFRLLLFVYCYMGFLAGLASFVQAELAQIVQPNAIVGRELEVLAAAVLGGASVFGGTGTVLGTVLGVLLVAVVRNGLILAKVSSYWHNVAVGVIIAVAASVTAYQSRMRGKAGS